MVFGWGESQDAHQQVYQQGGGNDQPNEAKFSHELVAGAAAFEGMKLFEDRQRKAGKPVSHEFAKELLAGIAGGEADRLAETKGMDFADRKKAQHHAKENAEKMYNEKYGGTDQYDPNTSDYPQEFQN